MFRLLKFVRLPAAEKILFIETLLLVPTVRIAIWVVPYRILQKGFVRTLSPKTDAGGADWRQIEKITNFVRLTSRFVPFASCLTQALAALYLLRVKGQDAELKIGVKKDENARFEAHAWLEKDGRIIIGKLSKHERFMALNDPQERNL